MRVVLTAALSGLVSCGGGSHDNAPVAPPSPPVLTRLAVSLTRDTIYPGDTIGASVRGFDDKGAPISIGTPTWTTDAPAVATVTESGVVAGAAVGLTAVVAAVSGTLGYAALFVAPAPVEKITVTPATTTLNIGPTQGLIATLVDRKGRLLVDREIVWTSSNPSAAFVSPVGVVTALARGVATITAASEGVSGLAVISVTDQLVPVAGVLVSPPSGSVAVGQSLQLVATLTDAAGNPLPGRRVTWTSSAPAVATVSDGGLVTTVATGTVLITATVDGQSASATITVSDDIIVRIGRPDSVQVVVDTLAICVAVASTTDIVSVVASVAPAVGVLDTPLTLDACGKGAAWTAKIIFAKIKSGRYQLIVRATDSRNSVGVASVPFQHQYGHSGGNSPPPGKKQVLPPPRPPHKGIP